MTFLEKLYTIKLAVVEDVPLMTLRPDRDGPRVQRDTCNGTNPLYWK